MSNLKPRAALIAYTRKDSTVIATVQGGEYRWICNGCSTNSGSRVLTEDEARAEIDKHADACNR